MLSLNLVCVQFGGEPLFEDVSFLVEKRDRIGLVGKNGAGKSTMLKVMAGQMPLEAGSVARQQGMTLGYLSQDLRTNKDETVFDETFSALAELTALEKKIEHCTEQLGIRTDYETDSYMKLIEDLHDANERYDLLGGHGADAEVEKVLLGLGFERTDFKRMLSEFSGGWQMRVELAKILVQHPDLLLLDEPTNHLDILSIQWLEEFLVGYEGAVILVSHDRAFLDNVTNRTIEISLKRIQDYRVPYSKYIEQRAERRALQQAAFDNQQKQIEQTEKFIERFRYKASKANQVQSRIKQLDKIDRVEVDEQDTSSIHFRFPPAAHAGKQVLRAEKLGKAYGSKTVLHDVFMSINRGEKVAFLGRNGEGKTTFSKIIAGKLDFTGSLVYGHQVNLGYYAQDQAESLDGDKTVLQTIDDAARGEIRGRIREILGSFLFSGDSVDKKVKVLSGGERARLALAKLLLEPYNLLVLDEPTNHLDMRSKDILKQALMRYDGAMVLVSHDRDFLKGLSTKVFEFRDGQVFEHIGDVYEFLAKRKLNSLDQLSLPKQDAAAKATEPPKQSQQERQRNKDQDKDLRKKQNRLAAIEEEISTLEKKLAQMGSDLADPARYQEAQKSGDPYKTYNELEASLQAKMEEWEILTAEIEKDAVG